MASPALMNYYAQLEAERKLPPGYLSRTRMIESNGNPNAVSPTGPVGPFQFTKNTARAYGLPLDQRTDEMASARAAADYAKDNMSVLQKALGRAPQGGELYMAHQQGGGGAAKLLTNMNTPAGQLTDPDNIRVNSGDPNAPASGIINKFIARYNGVSPGGNTGQGPTVANAAALPTSADPQAAIAALTPKPPEAAIRSGGGLVGMLGSEGGMTMDKMKSFMGSTEMGAATKGIGMLASAMAPPPAPPPPPPMAAPEENRPDMSLLALIGKKKKGLI